MTDRAPFYHRHLRTFGRWLFSVYHDIRVEGVGHVPDSGPAIIAANHPTYLDPAFLMVKLRRPVRFMAWEKPYKLPVLGRLMRAYGAIPVDMKKPGAESFAAAVKVLRKGEVLGIFPEGGRTKGLSPMNPLKSGVVRLAVITGAPIVPATITGGSRVWRRGTKVPKPGPISVHFHPPLVIPEAQRSLYRRDKDLERRMIDRLIAVIHRKLLPSMRKEERVDRLLSGGPQAVSPVVEGIPLIFLALCYVLLPRGAWPEFATPAAWWVAGYLAVLALELAGEARGWIVKWVRHLLPWITLVAIAHYTAGAVPPLWVFGAEACAAAFIVWLTVFRFSLYRRVRTMLLSVAYGTWLLQIASWGYG